MIVEINDKEFCDRIRKSPRLNELYDHFERIANGSTQVPYKVPKTNKTYLRKDCDYIRHEKIFKKNLCTFLKHGISSIPYLAEEFLRVDKALLDYANFKGSTQEAPLTYWETSSADGTRARTLAEYTSGKYITLTDSPNLGNKEAFDNSPYHPNSFFYHGVFIDICPKFLKSQTFHPAFKDGFDVIWENTTFQMYGNNRVEQIGYISQCLKPDGLLLLFEKLNANNTDDYLKMEKIKDKFKAKYFKLDQIKKKKENILNTMENGQVTKLQLIEATSKYYEYGALIWNSANFYEIVASNSKENIEHFLNLLHKPYVPKKFILENQMVSCLWGDISLNSNK